MTWTADEWLFVQSAGLERSCQGSSGGWRPRWAGGRGRWASTTATATPAAAPSSPANGSSRPLTACTSKAVGTKGGPRTRAQVTPLTAASAFSFPPREMAATGYLRSPAGWSTPASSPAARPKWLSTRDTPWRRSSTTWTTTTGATTAISPWWSCERRLISQVGVGSKINAASFKCNTQYATISLGDLTFRWHKWKM